MSVKLGPLLEPFELHNLTLRNRVAMAPMTRNRAGDGNAPHALNATYYQQRSDAALIITEATQICPEGMGYPGTPGIHSDAQIDGWREVTDAVHEAGGRIILQMWHVGRISHPDLQPNGQIPVAPSAIQPAGEAMTRAFSPSVSHKASTLFVPDASTPCADSCSCACTTVASVVPRKPTISAPCACN